MTYEQNVKSVLESYFVGFKDEIIDRAGKRICELETNRAIDRIINIIDERLEWCGDSNYSYGRFVPDVHVLELTKHCIENLKEVTR